MVGVRAWVHAIELSLVLFAIAAASVLTLRLVLGIAQAQAPERYDLLGITPKGGDVAAYVVTYLIPFLDVRFDDLAQMLSLLVLFVSIGLHTTYALVALLASVAAANFAQAILTPAPALAQETA